MRSAEPPEVQSVSRQELVHFTYLAVLAGCLVCAIWLEPVLKVGALRQVRRLAWSVLPVAAAFVAWDLLAVHIGWWSFDSARILGVRLGALPIEEVLFFLVVPVCAILAFEAARKVLGR
jgi:lycopene cyclase domain-containing protein